VVRGWGRHVETWGAVCGLLTCGRRFPQKPYRHLVSGTWTQTDVLTDGTMDVVSTKKYTFNLSK